ncbi:Snare region anchored in the vesicle membrane C-terminus family protein [Theileria parva strain Muguga]|uniref:t-SNARE coiled-coil homology domain-containing protein n=1 Tax=Theileria parva TaxID=5875 RepID=Q4N8E5_THEPA|nr:Snare region anchored in the vesicle membrane C-terminus family protein [Theileria parva strain Muguga]EAN33763.1 Snare region anchored in the vesicle membrane C-terminus family protein [Theileria parva strain Muguga]|eukprot:XP_766046.1 hypothetical protein [Theileria parva strain Muguga]
MSIYQREEELDRLLVQLKGLLIKYESHSSSAQSDKYAEGVLIYERVKCAESAYAKEIEKLQHQSKGSHNLRLQDKQKLLSELKFKLDHLKSLVEANQDKLSDKHADPNLPYSNKLIVWGNEIQDKTQDSINRIRDLTIDSEKIGADVTTDLEQQNESLNRIRVTIHGVDENLAAAKNTVKTIASAIVRDKCTIILVVTIILLIVSIGLCAYFFRDIKT